VDMTTLVEMMSIGTLIAYLVVSASTIVVRYQRRTNLDIEQTNVNYESEEIEVSNVPSEEEKLLNSPESRYQSVRSAMQDLVNSKVILASLNRYFHDSLISVCVFMIVVLTALFCLTCKKVELIICKK